MLESLIRYGRRLKPEPGLAPETIPLAVVFDSEGALSGLVPMGDPKQKGLLFPMCPTLRHSEKVSKGGAKSRFLVDSARVVTLYKVDMDDSKILEKHRYFVRLLSEAGKSVPYLAKIAEQVQDPAIRDAINHRLEELNAKPGMLLTFKYGEVFPLEDSAWLVWWRNYRKSLLANRSPKQNATKLTPMRCLATGEVMEPEVTHETIEGLYDVGGRAETYLISFDKDAFESYGLKQSANAAVSEEAMSAYRAGLNELIKNHSQSLAGAKVAHWYKDKIPATEDLWWLIEPPELAELNAQHQAKKLLESIESGVRPDLVRNYYYALALSGSGGRVMVRDWMEGPFKELAENVDQWFDDLEIVNLNGEKSAKPPGLERVITCLLPPKGHSQRYDDWVKPVGGERLGLLHATTKEMPIAHSVIPRLVMEHRNFILNGELDKLLKKENKDSLAGLMYSLLYARMGLIKAYHIRKYRKEGNTTLSEMLKPVLSEDFPSPAYQCGRLMAVLAKLQRRAMPNVEAGIVQRYYAAASTTPALVLGRLLRLSTFHMDKLESKASAQWFENKIADVSKHVTEPPPRALSLEDQSLFALGYYQQLAEMKEE